jgi:hypothetical protein
VINRAALMMVLLAAMLQPDPVQAQFSSDIPGVPRASVPFRGSHQNRWEWTFAGYRIPTTTDVGDTTAVGVRLSYGRSYRVQSMFEVGFDISIMDGMFERPPQDGELPAGVEPASNYMRAAGLYGLRLGAKWRPVMSLDPDGYGWQAAVGAAIQPSLRPLIGAERFEDSTRVAGQFSGGEDDTGLRGGDPFGRIHTATFISGMASYRAQRFLVDVALVAEAVSKGDEDDGGFSPLVKFDGLSPRLGAMYRLTPSLALGASYWGTGAPPWRDQIFIGVPGATKEEKFGFILTLGSRPESGTDLMISSPNGAWGESLRLYVRSRSTR